jgi:hypothetical protein
MRDETYERYKNRPPLDTYRSSIAFHIAPPRFIDVVKRRLELAIEFLVAHANKTQTYTLENGVKIILPEGEVGFVSEHVAQSQAPMFADHARRKRSVLDEADKERPRHVQKIGGFLCGDFGFDRYERESVSGFRLLESIHQKEPDNRRQFAHGKILTGVNGVACASCEDGILIRWNDRVDMRAAHDGTSLFKPQHST